MANQSNLEMSDTQLPLEEVVQLAKRLKNAAGEVKQNRRAAAALASRVSRLNPLFVALESQSKADLNILAKPLCDLRDLLEDAIGFIDAQCVASPSILSRIFSCGCGTEGAHKQRFSEAYSEFSTRLDDIISDFTTVQIKSNNRTRQKNPPQHTRDGYSDQSDHAMDDCSDESDNSRKQSSKRISIRTGTHQYPEYPESRMQQPGSRERFGGFTARDSYSPSPDTEIEGSYTDSYQQHSPTALDNMDFSMQEKLEQARMSMVSKHAATRTRSQDDCSLQSIAPTDKGDTDKTTASEKDSMHNKSNKSGDNDNDGDDDVEEVGVSKITSGPLNRSSQDVPRLQRALLRKQNGRGLGVVFRPKDLSGSPSLPSPPSTSSPSIPQVSLGQHRQHRQHPPAIPQVPLGVTFRDASTDEVSSRQEGALKAMGGSLGDGSDAMHSGCDIETRRNAVLELQQQSTATVSPMSVKKRIEMLNSEGNVAGYPSSDLLNDKMRRVGIPCLPSLGVKNVNGRSPLTPISASGSWGQEHSNSFIHATLSRPKVSTRQKKTRGAMKIPVDELSTALAIQSTNLTLCNDTAEEKSRLNHGPDMNFPDNNSTTLKDSVQSHPSIMPTLHRDNVSVSKSFDDMSKSFDDVSKSIDDDSSTVVSIATTKSFASTFSQDFNDDPKIDQKASINYRRKFSLLRKLQNTGTVKSEVESGMVYAMIAVDDDCMAVAVGSKVCLYRLIDWAVVAVLKGHSSAVVSLVMLHGHTMASGSSDNSIRVWCLREKKCITILHGHSTAVFSLAYRLDFGPFLVSAGGECVHIWSTEDFVCRTVLHAHNAYVYCILLLEDRTIVTGSADKTIKVFTESGEVAPEVYACLATLQGHNDAVRSLVQIGTNSVFASGSSDNSIKLWSIVDLSCLHTLPSAHSNSINDLASLSIPGDMYALISASDDRTLRVWACSQDLTSISYLSTLTGHNGRVLSVCPTAVPTVMGCQMIVSGGGDKNIHIWGQVSTTEKGTEP